MASDSEQKRRTGRDHVSHTGSTGMRAWHPACARKGHLTGTTVILHRVTAIVVVVVVEVEMEVGGRTMEEHRVYI